MFGCGVMNTQKIELKNEKASGIAARVGNNAKGKPTS